VPAFDHIFLVIMENHGYDEIMGSSDAPYLNQLADRYGVATNYVSVARSRPASSWPTLLPRRRRRRSAG